MASSVIKKEQGLVSREYCLKHGNSNVKCVSNHILCFPVPFPLRTIFKQLCGIKRQVDFLTFFRAYSFGGTARTREKIVRDHNPSSLVLWTEKVVSILYPGISTSIIRIKCAFVMG